MSDELFKLLPGKYLCSVILCTQSISLFVRSSPASFNFFDSFFLSGGTDDTVLKFDATQLERSLGPHVPASPAQMFSQHEVRSSQFIYTHKPHDSFMQDSIRAIAPHAVQDDIFLSGRSSIQIFN